MLLKGAGMKNKKAIEEVLNNYRYAKYQIESDNIFLKDIERGYLKSLKYDGLRVQNSNISNVTEDMVIKKENAQMRIKRNTLYVKRIDTMLDILNAEEKSLIKLKYLENTPKKNKEISLLLGIDYYKCIRILNNAFCKIEEFLLLEEV